MADQVQQDPQTGQQVAGVRVLGYLIQDGKTIYALLGAWPPRPILPPTFPQFTRTMEGFQRLTDRRQAQPPARARPHPHCQSRRSTLAQTLAANGVPEKRLEELAILNGMQLSDKLGRGMLFKVVGK